MKRFFLFFLIITFPFLNGCGQKEVAHGSSVDTYYGYIPENNSNMYEHARYPIGGRQIDQRLHMLNKPEVQDQIHSLNRSYFNSLMGVKPKKNNPNKPVQHSPFMEH